MLIPSSVKAALLTLLQRDSVVLVTTTTVDITVTTRQSMATTYLTDTAVITVTITPSPTTTVFEVQTAPLLSSLAPLSSVSPTTAGTMSAPATSTPASTASAWDTALSTTLISTPSPTTASPVSLFSALSVQNSSIIPSLAPSISASNTAPSSLPASTSSIAFPPSLTSLKPAMSPPSADLNSTYTRISTTLSLMTLITAPPPRASTSTNTSANNTTSQTTTLRPLTSSNPSGTSQPSPSGGSSPGLTTDHITGIVFGVVGGTLLLVFAIILVRRWVRRHEAAKNMAAGADLDFYITPPRTPPPPLPEPPVTMNPTASAGMSCAVTVMPTSAWSTTSDLGQAVSDQDTHQTEGKSVVRGSVSPGLRQQYMQYQRYIDQSNGFESGADEIAASVGDGLSEPPLPSGLSTRRVSQVPSSTALGEFMTDKGSVSGEVSGEVSEDDEDDSRDSHDRHDNVSPIAHETDSSAQFYGRAL